MDADNIAPVRSKTTYDDGVARVAIATAKKSVSHAEHAVAIARKAAHRTTSLSEQIEHLERRVELQERSMHQLQGAVAVNTAMVRESRDASMRVEKAVKNIRLSLGWRVVGAILSIGIVATAAAASIVHALLNSAAVNSIW